MNKAILLILPLLLLLGGEVFSQNEWSDLSAVYGDKVAEDLIRNRYVPINPSDKGQNPRSYLGIGEWKRLPVTGYEAIGLAYYNTVNTERRMFSADSRYVCVQTGSKKYSIFLTESGKKVRDISIPSDILSGAVYWHHVQPWLIYFRGNKVAAYDVSTGNLIESDQVFSFNVGAPYRGKYSQIAGGDASDISPTGHILLTKGTKYGKCVMVQFSDDDLSWKITGEEWTLPSGSDYAVAAHDGSHVIVVGQKSSGIPIRAYTPSGRQIGTIYGARGHSDFGPFLTKAGVKYGLGIKYNPGQARKAGGNTGDCVSIVYDIRDGKVVPLGRWTGISGRGKAGLNLSAQHSHSGFMGQFTYLRAFQVNDNASHAYKGTVAEFGFSELDPDTRLIAWHYCDTKPFASQPEAALSPDGKYALIKFGSVQRITGLMALVKLPPRIPKASRDMLLSGESMDYEELSEIPIKALYSSFPFTASERSIDSIQVDIPELGKYDSLFVVIDAVDPEHKDEGSMKFGSSDFIYPLFGDHASWDYDSSKRPEGVEIRYYVSDPPPAGKTSLTISHVKTNGFTVKDVYIESRKLSPEEIIRLLEQKIEDLKALYAN